MIGLMSLLAIFPVAEDWAVFEGRDGPGKGKHVVLLAGDEEYRSEEALPQLAKILATRHGFKCTVLFSIGKDGTIDPERRDQQPGLHLLESADLAVLMLRFRQWPEEEMRRLEDYLRSEKPILALRTSTHAFAHDSGPFTHYRWNNAAAPPPSGVGFAPWKGGFGREVLGETWVSHWGEHGKQATRGVPEQAATGHPVLRGVENVFVPTDVYEAHPPKDCEILMRGQVVAGMSPSDPPASGTKRNALDSVQPLNDPMMPVVWAREALPVLPGLRRSPVRPNRVLTTTMGSALDLSNEGFRRLLVNGVYWLTGLEAPAKADVRLVGDFKPSSYGFGGFKRGIRPKELQGRVP